ncbi:MAG: sulfotransferase family 2 domain-containing protein [Armatimonadetes bacterium]|nr:sulfotransferase family 2 domain-containing protein [Armatimonadota bacterium]
MKLLAGVASPGSGGLPVTDSKRSRVVILSHRWQYLFLKPRKVAGTSLQVALLPHCGPDDVVTGLTKYRPQNDRDWYRCQPQNNRGHRGHGTAAEVRRRVGEELWGRYFKFSVIRNPWDLVVSQYHWANRDDLLGQDITACLRRFLRYPWQLRKNWMLLRILWHRCVRGADTGTFPFFAEYLLDYYPPNDPHYFDPSGDLSLDFYIRYEHLQPDYELACRRIGIPCSVLPSLKSKSREPRIHYSKYYDSRTRALVARTYRRHIALFGYRFETE